MPTTTTPPSALPHVLAHQGGHWRLIGSATLTWSVFRMYDASLYYADEYGYPNGRYSLVLHYLRNLSADQIVAASAMEMKRISNPDDEVLRQWTNTLEQIMPDVIKGDVLVGVFDAAKGVRFFYNDVACGQIDSPEFARAFAAIWLSESTRSPSLRHGLLGRSDNIAEC